MLWIIIVIAVIVIIGIAIWAIYNGLVKARIRVKEAWSGIDVPVEAAFQPDPQPGGDRQGYASHEREVFENVTKARTALMGAGDAKSAAEANNQLTGALKTLFAVAENYPQLRASENFMQLQKELSDVESKIAYARQFYNSNVMDYNQRIQVFPSNMLANGFGFKQPISSRQPKKRKADVKVSFAK